MDVTDNCIEKTTRQLEEFINSLDADENKKAGYLNKGNAFTRKSKLPFLFMCKIGLLSVKSQYAAEVPLALNEVLGNVWTEPVTVSKSAYCQRRQEIKPELFRDWARDIAHSDLFRHKLWHGFIPVSIDGTTLSLPDLYDAAEVFGVGQNHLGDNGPIAKISLLTCLLEDIILDVEVRGKDEGERTAALRMLSGLGPNHLLILDRGYPSYVLFKLLLGMGIKFIIRVPASFNKSVKAFAKSGKPNGTVTCNAHNKLGKMLKGSALKLQDTEDVKLRCVKFITPKGTTEYLVTNLDEEDCPDDVVAEGYKLRWRIEVDILFLKNEERWAVMSGYKSICILQDIYAACVLFNIQSLIMQLCEAELDKINKERDKVNKKPLRIDHSVALSIIDFNMLGILSDRPGHIEQTRGMLAIIIHTAYEYEPSQSRVRILRMTRLRGKHQTETNYKDSLLI